MQVQIPFFTNLGGILLSVLLETVSLLRWQHVVMWAIGGILIYLAIRRKMEPALLLPMGFGAILVNLPLSGAVTQIYDGAAEIGALDVLFDAGMANELFPLLLFIGIGAMIDFAPLLSNPKLMIFGAAAQFGIFFTLLMALLFGFDLQRRGVHRHHRRGGRPHVHLRGELSCSRNIWAPSSWRPIPTWRWCPSSSRR